MDPLLEKLAGAVIAALLAGMGILWKESHKWQARFLNEQAKRLEDLRDHGRASEMFLIALKQKRRESSDRPPWSR